MQYTKIDSTAFQKLQLNAGIIVDSFTPSTATIGNILGATTGGFQFATNPEFVDFGEDMDNVPANTWQLKRIKSYDPSASGTFLTVTAALIKTLIAGAVNGTTTTGTGNDAVTTTDTTHIIPTHEIASTDFQDIWVIGDYSDKNTGTSAGFLAIHLKKSMNTAGFQWQSTKDEKGQFSFEFHGHYDLTSPEDPPFEIYCQAGTTA